MERETDDRVNECMRHDIDRHFVGDRHVELRVVAIGDEDRDDGEPARQQALDQPLALDDELAQPPRLVRGLERR